MQTEIIIAGFGGQGILFAGQMLAYAAMESDRNVTWIPSYGPEMRGGTANVTVVISDEAIGSPLVRRPGVAIVLNEPSLEKYGPLVKDRGCVIYNDSLIQITSYRSDVTYIAIAASDIATELGEARLVSMVALGALMASTDLISPTQMPHILKKHLPEQRQHLLRANKAALKAGALRHQRVRAT